MKFTAREYQKLIIRFVLRVRRGNVWASMGSGKTGALLKAINRMIAFGRLEGNVLICAPLTVAAVTWPDEARKWRFPNIRRIIPIVGTPAEREAALKKKARVYSINYENIPWLIEYLGAKNWPFSVIIADECTRLKSFRTKQGGARAKALAKVAFGEYSMYYGLTGTPAPNGYADLWGQQYFVDKGKRLGTSFTGFQDRYYRPVRDKSQSHGMGINYVIRNGADKAIRRKLEDCTITVDAADYFDVSELRHVTREVILPKKARKAYDKMEQQFFAKLEDGEIEALNSAAKSGKLLQLAAGAVYLTEDGEQTTEWEEVHKAKLDELESIIEELSGAPVIVAYHWKHDLARLQKRFPKGVKIDKKPETQARWNRGEIPILFAHPSSAGHGLNLQDGGCDIVFFSEWYDAETHAQIIERIGPIRQAQSGHPRVVSVYHIRAVDTIDVAVALNLSGKIKADKAIRQYMKEKQKKVGIG